MLPRSESQRVVPRSEFLGEGIGPAANEAAMFIANADAYLTSFERVIVQSTIAARKLQIIWVDAGLNQDENFLGSGSSWSLREISLSAEEIHQVKNRKEEGDLGRR